MFVDRSVVEGTKNESGLFVVNRDDEDLCIYLFNSAYLSHEDRMDY